MRLGREEGAAATQIKGEAAGYGQRWILERRKFFQRNFGSVDVELRFQLERAIKNVARDAPRVFPQFEAGEVVLVMLQLEVTGQAIEMKSPKFDVIESEIRIENGSRACAASAEGAAQKAAHGITGVEKLLDVTGRRVRQAGLERPRALRQETPIAIELEPDVHIGGHLPAARDGLRKAKAVRRVLEIAHHIVPIKAGIPRLGRMQVPHEGRSTERAQDAAFPIHRPGDRDCFGFGAAQDVDEIVPQQEILGL